MLYLFYFFGDTLASNNVLYEVMSWFIFSTNQSAMSLLNLVVSKQSTYVNIFKCLAYDWTVKDEL